MLPAFLILAASLLPAAAYAQSDTHGLSERAFSVPEGAADYLTEDAIERQKAVHAWLENLNLSENAVDSSMDYMKDNREKLMELMRQVDQSLGIRDHSGSLLVFLSHSMSDAFIRPFGHEAAWSGRSSTCVAYYRREP